MRAVAAAALFAATVSAHGNVTSPPARLPGPAMVQACGQTAVNAVLQDGTTPLEDVLQPLASCKLDLCRGAVFADNKDRVQTFRAGQVIPFTAQIPIPHEGPANVSVVNVATNKVVGEMLLVFDTYADEKLKVLPPNNTAFSVTMPSTLGTQCKVAGECVLQWFWFGTAAKQTYESCVDFVMEAGNAGGVGKNSTGKGSGTGSGSGTNSTSSTGSGSKGSGSSTGTGSTTGGTGSESSSTGTAVAGPALPGTGEGNFGGVEGSIATADAGKAAVVQSSSSEMANMPGMSSTEMANMPGMSRLRRRMKMM
ncbi:hypothetical protein GQ53DRAFT_30940 [Thozetella sp. PMI_491]|nr:hypothetical protein GQ53DRAFT_30940 [Thozetella sp. PMI_491]